MSKAAELAALIGSQTALSNRNLIINGAMQVSQRGTSKTATSAATYLLDRFEAYSGDYANYGYTVSQETDSPTGHSNSLKYNFDDADTSPSAEHSIYYHFEGQDLQHLEKGTSSAKSVTASFWVKSSLSGTYILELMDVDNSNRHINKAYTINTANTWEHKTITFAGDTTGTLDNDVNKSLSLTFWLAAASGNTSGTLQTSWGPLTQANRAVGQTNLGATADNAFLITGIQLEVGEQATPFEHEDYTTTLTKCRRYFIRYYGDESDGYPRWFNPAHANDSYMGGNFSFPVQMRATPTVTGSVTYQNADGLGTGDVTREGMNLYVLSTSVTVIAGAYITNNSSDHITVDAEL